jgi:hypothetical protein
MRHFAVAFWPYRATAPGMICSFVQKISLRIAVSFPCRVINSLNRAESPSTPSATSGSLAHSGVSHAVCKNQQIQMLGARNTPNGSRVVAETGRRSTHCRAA